MFQFYRITNLIQTVNRLIGVFGNLLLFVVYSQGSLRKLSVSVYFRCTAVYWTSQIVFDLFLARTLFKLTQQSEISYKLLAYFHHVLMPTAIWFEVAASFDRFLTILFPMRSRFLQKPFAQFTIVSAVIVYNMLFFLFIPIQSSNSSAVSNENDFINKEKFIRTVFILNLVNDSLAPFVLMLVLSIATFVGVLRAHERMKSSLGNGTNASSQVASRKKQLRDMKFGVTIISLNVFFFVFMFFYRLNLVVSLNPFNNSRPEYYLLFLIFSQILGDMPEFYYSSNFFVHFAVNSLFRREFFKLFTRFLPFLRRIKLLNSSRD